RVARQIVGAPCRALPAFQRVAICKIFGIVAKQHEQIGVPPEREFEIRIRAEFLAYRSEPAFRALPGIEIAIKLIRAKRPVAQREQYVRIAKHGLRVRDRSKRQNAIVAVRLEAARKLARKSELLRDGLRAARDRTGLFVSPPVSERSPQPHFRSPGNACN